MIHVLSETKRWLQSNIYSLFCASESGLQAVLEPNLQPAQQQRHLNLYNTTIQQQHNPRQRAPSWPQQSRSRSLLMDTSVQRHCDVQQTTESRTKTGSGGNVYFIISDTITRGSHNNKTKGCDTTTQTTGRLIRGLLLIPVRLCPHVPGGRTMEEVIDSSHHNLWEGETLPFPFWVTGVIILKFWKGHTRAISVALEPVWSTAAPTVTIKASTSQKCGLISADHFIYWKRCWSLQTLTVCWYYTNRKLATNHLFKCLNLSLCLLDKVLRMPTFTKSSMLS